MERNTVKIQGFNVDTFSLENAVNYIIGASGAVVTINPEIIQNAKKNKELCAFIKNANLVIPDGIGVELGLMILGHKVKRIAGIEFAKRLVGEYSKESKPIAFIGAKPEIIEKAVNNLKTEFPDLNIAYKRDGYFKNEDEVLNELQNSGAQLVLVALGSPKQEFFIEKALKLLPNAVMIGIGGSFDVWSGLIERAPEIWQNLGLEWLYRTIKEPKRFKRIFPTLPLFVINVFYERLFGEK